MWQLHSNAPRPRGQRKRHFAGSLKRYYTGRRAIACLSWKCNQNVCPQVPVEGVGCFEELCPLKQGLCGQLRRNDPGRRAIACLSWKCHQDVCPQVPVEGVGCLRNLAH